MANAGANASIAGDPSVVIVGARGMLGSTWVDALGQRPITVGDRGQSPVGALDLPDFDLRNESHISSAINDNVAIVINCAGYTDVDGAELNPDPAFEVNARSVEMLAERCAQVGALLVHYSTDYVFDGERTEPYPVGHPHNPINVYGKSKSEGEHNAQRSGADALIIRTSWLISAKGKNFVRTIARAARERATLSIVDDQRGRPTSTSWLVEATRRLIAQGARGEHHVCLEGECSWFELGEAVTLAQNASCKVTRCASDDYPSPAPRPRYSVLDLTKTTERIGPAPHWRDELARILPLVNLTRDAHVL